MPVVRHSEAAAEAARPPYGLRTNRQRTQRAEGSPSVQQEKRKKKQARQTAPKRRDAVQQDQEPNESDLAEQRRRVAEEEEEEEERARAEEEERMEEQRRREEREREWLEEEEGWAIQDELRAAAERRRQARIEEQEREQQQQPQAQMEEEEAQEASQYRHNTTVIERSLEILVNKRLLKQRRLPDLKKSLFDLGELSEQLDQELLTMRDSELFALKEARLFVKALTPKATLNRHDVNDFGAEETETVHQIMNTLCERYPDSKFSILVEVRGKIDPTLKRVEVSSTAALPTATVPFPPGLVTPQTGRRTTTNARAEATQGRLEKIELAGNFERQLVNQWECREKGCINYAIGFFFPDLSDSKLHYNLQPTQMKSWSTAISKGEATLLLPPVMLLDYWRQEQGPIQRESKAPIRKTFQQRTETGMAILFEQVEQSRLENLLREEKQEAKRQREREEREDEQRRRDQRTQWREEEQQCRDDERRQREDEDREEERRRRREEQELQRQRKHEEEALRRQLTLLQYQQHMPQQQLYSLSGLQQHHLDVLTPSRASTAPLQHFNAPLLPSHLPLTRPLRPQPRVDPSSPISSEADEEIVLDDFFQWKIERQQRAERKAIWGRVWDTVSDNGWSIADLKAMTDSSGRMYKRAVAAGIPEGIARHFGDELRSYKRYCRE